jgi:hypothetical protein
MTFSKAIKREGLAQEFNCTLQLRKEPSRRFKVDVMIPEIIDPESDDAVEVWIWIDAATYEPGSIEEADHVQLKKSRKLLGNGTVSRIWV